MTRFVAKRLAHAVMTVVGVVLLTFAVLRIVPGDPVVAYAGARATPDQLERARQSLGLDAPLGTQLGDYLRGLAHGDWGTSIRTRHPVVGDLERFVPATVELVLAALVLAVLVGVPLGLVAARFRRSWADRGIRGGSLVLVSTPAFVLALLLQNTLAGRLGWFPVAGEYDRTLDTTSPLTVYSNITLLDAAFTGNWPIVSSTLHHLVLPALVVAAYPMGVVIAMTRASVLEQLSFDYVQLARSLGFGRSATLLRFATRPAMNPVVSILALVFAYSLANTFLVEAIFNWPGLGSYAAESISALDAPAVAGVTLLVALVYVVANLLVDVLQTLIDPRVRSW